MMKKIEILLRQIILKLLLVSSKRKINKEKPVISKKSNVLFLRLNRIGDALVTTPLLTQIKKEIGCNIIVLADVNNYFIFEHCPDVDKTIIYKKGLNGIKQLKSTLEQNNIDTIVDLHDDVSTTVSIILRMSKTKQIFGLKKNNEKLFTHTVPRLNPSDHHIIERTFELAKLFGFNPNLNTAKVNYQIKEKSIGIAEDHLKQYKNKFLLGINITAGSEARFWGVNNFKRLIEQVKRYQINYLLFTSHDYYNKAQQITEEKNIFPPSKDFDIFAAGISKLNMLFTPDTSVVHIASMFKIPVFGLYVKYKTDDMVWSPYKTIFDSIITADSTLLRVDFDEVINKFIPFLEKQVYVKANS
jgi:ADP-heptose:LPS heptosyltransferase